MKINQLKTPLHVTKSEYKQNNVILKGQVLLVMLLVQEAILFSEMACWNSPA